MKFDAKGDEAVLSINFEQLAYKNLEFYSANRGIVFL